MKRISQNPFLIWSFWVMPLYCGVLAWYLRQWNYCVLLPLYVLLTWLIDHAFSVTVYDDGDTLLLKRSGTKVRLPFTNISRVSYDLNAFSRRVTLQLLEPCELGSKVRFFAAGIPHEVEDDLHRRSRCCKECDAHTPAERETG